MSWKFIPEDYSDEGSTLGRFWYKIFKGNHLLTDIFTRGTIAVVISCSLLSIPFLISNWIVYILGSLGIILSQALFSWRGWGSFKIKMPNGKEVEFCRSDTVTYTIMGICIFCIITFKIL